MARALQVPGGAVIDPRQDKWWAVFNDPKASKSAVHDALYGALMALQRAEADAALGGAVRSMIEGIVDARKEGEP